MSLCKFSSQYTMETSTLVENIFITEYMPSAPIHCIKAYLYGLMLCQKADCDDNCVEKMSVVLGLTPAELEECFYYWQTYSLVTIIPGEPFQVVYNPPKASGGSLRKFDTAKYETFNRQAQELLHDRVILPTEYNEYYLLIENLSIEPDAVLLIIKYCTDLKGAKISSAYIITVIRDFASQNIKTVKTVEEHLKEQELHSQEVLMVLKALGLKRTVAETEECNMYAKWTTRFNFTHGTILEVAKSVKNKGGFFKLDELLSKYYEQKLFTIQDIQNYSSLREEMFKIAKTITSTIGVYYQNLEIVVDTYITDWLAKGYSEDVLKEIATYCFKKSVRTLEGLNDIISKFYKLGLLTLPAIKQYIGDLVSTDAKIKQIIDACGLLRNVNSWDRDSYRTWTYAWGLTDEIILYACEKSKDKTQPMQYLNRLLATLHEKNVKSLAEAKKELEKEPKSDSKNNISSREYNAEELNTLFDNLDNIEVK